MNRAKLIKTDRGYHLMVEDKPFLILGGEIHNSSASDIDYMQEKVWPSVRKLNLNTLIVPIYWELIEPQEGIYDDTLVKALIEQATAEKTKLVFLLFGLWKNAESTYVPDWVKQDTETYFLARDRFGKPFHSISPLCEKAVEKDAAAFSRLMASIEKNDTAGTVVMVQVENEMGIVGDVRDFSAAADAAYAADIPQAVAQWAGKQGSWQTCFDTDAPEFFMAYQYACAVQRIAKSGKTQCNLPMYVNCWMDQFPRIPGNFPSGGPVAYCMEIWKQFAPEIDMLCPDIYLDYFEEICGQFAKPNNPLFIPEARPADDSAANVFSAVGRFHGLGFSPFAIEDLGNQEVKNASDEVMETLDIAREAFRPEGAGEVLAASYRVLANLSDVLLQNYGTANLQGFTQYGRPGTMLHFDAFDVIIRYTEQRNAKGGGLVVQLEKDAFLVAGLNFTFSFVTKADDRRIAQVVTLEEGEYTEDGWKKHRVLNGDERYIPQLGERAECQYIRVRAV